MGRILIVGPDSEQAIRWRNALQRDVTYVPRIQDADPKQTDAVLLDLARVGAEVDFDEEFAASAIRSSAQRNPDAFWLLIVPPAVQASSLRLLKILAHTLSGGASATSIAVEPHAVDSQHQDLSGWLMELDRLAALPIAAPAVGQLEPDVDRCVRRLLHDVDSAELTPLTEGQGKAKTFRVNCRVGGAAAPLRVVKIGPALTIQTEYANYMKYVRNRLGDNRHPTLDSSDMWSVDDTAGLVYTFVVGHPQPLAEVMAGGDASGAIDYLYQRVLSNWLSGPLEKKQQLSAFIDEYLQDVTLDTAEQLWTASHVDGDPESPIPWLRDLRSRNIDIELPDVVAHGDLHGYNVLVDADGRPWLIDFYHTRVRSGLFDFSYAESALLLHRPSGRPHAVECSTEELCGAEKAGAAIRPELDVIRAASARVWGTEALGLYHLARSCCALRRLRFHTTESLRAKWVAHFAAVAARRLNPEWDAAPTREAISF